MNIVLRFTPICTVHMNISRVFQHVSDLYDMLGPFVKLLCFYQINYFLSFIPIACAAHPSSLISDVKSPDRSYGNSGPQSHEQQK